MHLRLYQIKNQKRTKPEPFSRVSFLIDEKMQSISSSAPIESFSWLWVTCRLIPNPDLTMTSSVQLTAFLHSDLPYLDMSRAMSISPHKVLGVGFWRIFLHFCKEPRARSTRFICIKSEQFLGKLMPTWVIASVLKDPPENAPQHTLQS